MSAVNATPRGNRFKNLTGQRFGRLVVEGEAEPDKYKRARWLCVCDCGKRTTAHGSNLRRGHTTSCGCEQRAAAAARATRHGHARKGRLSPTFRSWVDMVRRCRDEKHKSYPDYGGRGVRVAPEWAESFEAFLAAVGEVPEPGYTIERDDVNGHYEPGNVRWVPKAAQARNKRNTRKAVYRGEQRPVIEWCEILGLNYETVISRLNRGWDDERALSTPPRS